MTEHKAMLCVGGPRAGERYAIMRGTGFRVPVKEPSPDPDAIDYMPNAPEKIAFTDYRSEVFHTPQGDVSFWVPVDQTPLQTIELLLQTYENYERAAMQRAIG